MSQMVEISGWWGSGKSILRGVLDGHPQVFANPVHDGVLFAFRQMGPRLESLKEKDTEQLRILLGFIGHYYRLEKAAIEGVHYDFSSQVRKFYPFPIDFYSMDKNIYQELLKVPEWNPEIISKTIYKYMAQELSLNTSEIEHYASLGAPYVNHLLNFKTNFPNGKYIYVDRSVEGIIATRSGRRPIDGQVSMSSINGYTNFAIDLINKGEVEKILSYKRQIESLQKEYPEDFLILPFDQVVQNSEEMQNNVAQFLKIKVTDTMNYASHLGEELICDGQKYLGQENDDPTKLLTSEELNLIQIRKEKYLSQTSINLATSNSFSYKVTKKLSILFDKMSEKLK